MSLSHYHVNSNDILFETVQNKVPPMRTFRYQFSSFVQQNMDKRYPRFNLLEQ